MRLTVHHVRSDLPRNFGERAVSGPQPSWSSGGSRGPPHHDRLRRGYAAPVAPERSRLPQTGPPPADTWPFRPRARNSRSLFDVALAGSAEVMTIHGSPSTLDTVVRMLAGLW